MKAQIQGPQSLNGRIAAPGSKAYTHRALVASLLSEGETTTRGPSWCDDAIATLRAIHALGVDVLVEDDTIVSQGLGRVQQRSDTAIDCGESGTTLRLLTAVAATSTKPIKLRASASLGQRPQTPLLNSLRELGASVSTRTTSEGFDVEVTGPLKGGETWIEGNVSSQFVSGLLFATPLAQDDVTIHIAQRLESRPYAELSIDVLQKHGITIEDHGDTFHIPAPQKYLSAHHKVPGDFSSVAFLVSGVGIAGDEITVTGISDYPYEPDVAIVKILDKAGADTQWDETGVTVKRKRLTGFEFDARDNPDLVPSLTVLGAFAEGESEITGVRRLRYKETNRLVSVPSELAKMGAKIAVGDDKIKIHGTDNLRGSTFDSWGDHRVAMACSIAALSAKGRSSLHQAEAISKSYPGFFRDLAKLGVQLDVE